MQIKTKKIATNLTNNKNIHKIAIKELGMTNINYKPIPHQEN